MEMKYDFERINAAYNKLLRGPEINLWDKYKGMFLLLELLPEYGVELTREEYDAIKPFLWAQHKTVFKFDGAEIENEGGFLTRILQLDDSCYVCMGGDDAEAQLNKLLLGQLIETLSQLDGLKEAEV